MPILLELQYLPPIQYFTKFLLHEQVIIEQWENYQKGSYRNRCVIVGPNGLQRLTVPLRSGKNEGQNIQKVEIAYDEPWQIRHWRAICTAYNNSPYFPYYEGQLEPFFQRQFTFLFDFNKSLLNLLLDLLQIKTSIIYSARYEKSPEVNMQDFRNGIFPKKHRQKEDPNFYAAAYPQVFLEKHGFLPNLSILDLLFCTGPQAQIVLEESIKKE
ncbi:MAG: WbqC family protein [Bacteroidetes bacterium]|nr:WbqC family protein [Bacteroidota bacterium]